MLRMSKLADYAFIILVHMSQKKGQIWSAAALAEGTTLPLPTVAKLMKLLAKGKLVTPQRGAAGGYVLSVSPEKMTIAAIIEVVDGPISLTECAGKALGKKVCDCAVSVCPIKEKWSNVNRAIRKSLESVFLSDLISTDKSAA